MLAGSDEQDRRPKSEPFTKVSSVLNEFKFSPGRRRRILTSLKLIELMRLSSGGKEDKEPKSNQRH